MGQCFSKPSEKKTPPPATEVNGPGVVSPTDINVGINSPVRPLPPPPAKSGTAANWSFINTVYWLCIRVFLRALNFKNIYKIFILWFIQIHVGLSDKI